MGVDPRSTHSCLLLPSWLQLCKKFRVNASHFPLLHSHFNVWGSAMLKGPTTATLDTPPNHHLFNTISNNHLGQMSPLLKRRQHANTSNGSVPVINFNIPNNVFQIFKPPAAVRVTPVQGTTLVTPVQGTASALVTPIAHISPQLSVTEMLVSADHVPGPKLPLEEFCRMYHLTDGI
ncbi:uncharacterized protein LACBIDRAFT_322604 [Laccaria bicolor S238N-H82]|uniref:Predicted protein n=1 Tax=Laccaria bicolor (strain S238N-H82 / ATCC MYA-4686) TaxID=486041 RepID=B0CWW8_LACBS|nr:uncharacterized protein LACBIDRAFT_322604 [Laccaria bicolor S238N-H82]EDR13144.1 predicted protein [Laccaria bicolor S238N-H82]|eukprot:XP_001875642.1 predicted protein [Laccaria bicolor S238N-H82]